MDRPDRTPPRRDAPEGAPRPSSDLDDKLTDHAVSVDWNQPPSDPHDLAYVAGDNRVLAGDNQPTQEEWRELEANGSAIRLWDDYSARIQVISDKEALALRDAIESAETTTLPDGRERIEYPLYRISYDPGPARSPEGHPRQIYSPGPLTEDYRDFVAKNGISVPDEHLDESGLSKVPPTSVTVAHIVTSEEYPRPFVTGHSLPGTPTGDGSYASSGGALEVVVARDSFEFEEMSWEQYLDRYHPGASAGS